MKPPLQRLALGLLVGLALAWTPSLGSAQPAAPEKVKFDTVDQVTLEGTFYPSAKGKKSPCVLLLHKISGNSQQAGWDDLAKELQKNDFAVLSFDFRGHGNSVNVGKEFWAFPLIPNKNLVKGFHPQNPKLKIGHKDFANEYFVHLVNDIAAAKLYLDRRNDAGDCNSSNLVLIGAEDGAALGALWMAAECYRYRIINFKPDTSAESKDVTCAVWLSFNPTVGGRALPVRDWLVHAAREQKVPMAFFYGDKDTPSETKAKDYLKAIKGGKEAPEFTGEQKIAKAEKLAGHGLLSKDLETTSWLIEKYLKPLFKDRGKEWEKHDPEAKEYAWAFPGSRPIQAKRKDEKALLPLPINYLIPR